MNEQRNPSYFLVDVGILKRIESIEQKLDTILEMKKSSGTDVSLSLGDWIHEKKAIELLGVKKTTLWKLRNSNLLIATKTRPIFYSLKSIQNYLSSHL